MTAPLPTQPGLRKPAVWTPASPKWILHLSAELVNRKISVRQENIRKLRPIGGEEVFLSFFSLCFFFSLSFLKNRSLLALLSGVLLPELLLHEKSRSPARHLHQRVCASTWCTWFAAPLPLNIRQIQRNQRWFSLLLPEILHSGSKLLGAKHLKPRG